MPRPAITRRGLTVLLRAPRTSDTPYACRSMLGENSRLAPSHRHMTAAEFNRGPGAELEARWKDPDFPRVVACVPGDEDQILGFAMGRPRLLSYLHVRGSFGNLGLATLLASLFDVRPGEPAAVEFDTRDLSRPEALPERGLPVGLLHNPDWRLTLLPWTAPLFVID